ncbi:MAG: DUF2299 family protein [Candidatus Hodarchaeales archaeon]|jgi:hypothetical protein
MGNIDRTKVLNWITEENLFQRTIKTDKDKFRFLIKYANINLEVFSPSQNPDRLLIVAPIQVHPSHLQRLEQLNIEERFKFLTELRIFFFQGNHDFKMVPRDPKNLGEHLLTSVIISDFLLVDKLTKTDFLHQCRKVAFGALGFIQRMYLKLGLADEGFTASDQKNIYV